MKKRAQTLSLDLMIGIGIFVAILLMFFGVLFFNPGRADASLLDKEGEFIVKTLESDDPDIGIMEQNQIDNWQLEELVSMDYEDLKAKLGIRSDFCIFLEDENGNVVPIETSDGRYVNGIGSDEVVVAGNACETES